MHATVYLEAINLASSAAKKRVSLTKKLTKQAPKARRAEELRKQQEIAQAMLAGLLVGSPNPELLQTARQQVEQCQRAYLQYMATHKLLSSEAKYLEELKIKDLEQQQELRQQQAIEIQRVLQTRH